MKIEKYTLVEWYLHLVSCSISLTIYANISQLVDGKVHFLKKFDIPWIAFHLIIDKFG